MSESSSKSGNVVRPVRARIGRVLEYLLWSKEGIEKRDKVRKHAERFNRLPRIARMENHRFVAKGGAVLEKPDQRVIDMIQAEEPLVHYFPVANTNRFQEGDFNWEFLITTGSSYYNAVLSQLDKKIKHDFPDRNIGLRGIQTSLNGLIRYKDSVVMDVVDVARRGNEQDVIYPLLEDDFNTASEESVTKGWHSVAMGESILFRRKLRRSGRAGEIFPAMIVYDQSKIAPGYQFGNKHERHILPGAVLAVYVLDAPVEQ